MLRQLLLIIKFNNIDNVTLRVCSSHSQGNPSSNTAHYPVVVDRPVLLSLSFCCFLGPLEHTLGGHLLAILEVVGTRPREMDLLGTIEDVLHLGIFELDFGRILDSAAMMVLMKKSSLGFDLFQWADETGMAVLRVVGNSGRH